MRRATVRSLDALALARERIEAYHRRQLPKDDRFSPMRLGWNLAPLDGH